MKVASYFKVAFVTTYNIILNALTLGRYVWLEGRVRKWYPYELGPEDFSIAPKSLFSPPRKRRLSHSVKKFKTITGIRFSAFI